MIIYKAENKKTGEVYIGKTIKTLHIRKNQHINDSKRGSNYRFHKALNKYGGDNFEWEILCETDSNSKLNLLEIFYISAYKRMTSLYNLTDGGEGNLGWIPTEETRGKIGIANSKRIISDETRKKLSEAGKGRKHTEEAKKKIGLIHKGKIISEEAKKKIGEANSKYTRDDSYRKKMSEVKKGEIRSEETRLKMSNAKKLYWKNKKEENNV